MDDGAPTLDAGLEALQAFWTCGVRRVVVTPHLDGAGATGLRRDRIEAAYGRFADAAAEHVPDIELELGFEVRIDDPEADLSDRGLGLSTGGHLLIEFPQLTLPAYSGRMLEVVFEQDWVPVLAHPERYAGIEAAYAWIARWRESGAVMCVNLGSLVGEYGPEAERVARRMLREGHCDVIASDHHARPRRSTTLGEGWEMLTAGGNETRTEAATLLLRTNPLAVLAGKTVTRVPPIDLGGGWFDRLTRRFLRGS